MSEKRKFKRRPNGSGTVVKLSGNRRKPYCARVSAGYDVITGNPIQKVVGTYETREEALDALTIYRLTESGRMSKEKAEETAPDIYHGIEERREREIPTFAGIYYILNEREFEKMSRSTVNSYRNAFRHLAKLHNRKVSTITLQEMQDIFDADTGGYGVKSKMKILCSKVFQYAVIHQYCSRNDDYTSFIDCGKVEKSKKHRAFTAAEIRKLEADGGNVAKLVLVYIYTGLRASELLGLPESAIHLHEDADGADVSYLIAGSKTDAGRDRVVPIHPAIEKYIQELFIDSRMADMPYQKYRDSCFMPLMEKLGMKHLPHDTRVTFTTLCQLSGVDVFSRKRILGHKMNDITFDTYTDTVVSALYAEVCKIKV